MSVYLVTVVVRMVSRFKMGSLGFGKLRGDSPNGFSTSALEHEA